MDILLEKPTTYHIRVKGHLDERWSKRLGGMIVTPIEVSSQKIVTQLSGQVADQATLFGVLLALYDMRLPLLSVFCEDDLPSGYETLTKSR